MMSGQAHHTEAHFLLSMFEVAAVAVELPVIVGPVIRCRRHVLPCWAAGKIATTPRAHYAFTYTTLYRRTPQSAQLD